MKKFLNEYMTPYATTNLPEILVFQQDNGPKKYKQSSPTVFGGD